MPSSRTERVLTPGRDRSPRKVTSEHVSVYVRDERLRVTNGNIYSKPTDLAKIISMRVDGEDRGSGADRVMCEMVYDVEKMNAILGSNLYTHRSIPRRSGVSGH